MNGLLLAIMFTTPTVHTVEVNTVYSRETGAVRIVQVIYWGRQGSPFLHVREWHMLTEKDSIQRTGRRRYPITVMHGLRAVRARRLKFTHTYHDPEEDDREFVQVCDRRRLE
jgi:hypothetical protein